MAYDQLDLYHRAFKAYKRELGGDIRQDKLHDAICRAAMSRERMKSVRFSCKIDSDWIEAIEKHLIYIEKAILENRQFILQQGETHPIEKAKRVSKASVEHLAQHSEMITHLPEPGEELIPDKIYVVENDSNFAVYENRFLYMLLLDLNDFVDAKYAKIVETVNKYSLSLTLEKAVTLGKRNLNFSLSVQEDSQGERDAIYGEEAHRLIRRIGEIQRVVTMLLQTPLMKDVSRAPLVKPPIARTNILKMDSNFKMAVALYDYLCAYEADGFSVEEIGEDLDRFSGAEEANISELVVLSSYLMHRYGGKLDTVLEHRWEEENNRIREQEDLRAREALQRLKQRLLSGECTLEEYVRALEERNGSLELDRARIYELEQDCAQQAREIHELADENEALRTEGDSLRRTIDKQRQQLRMQEERYEKALAEQKEAYEAALADLQQRYEELEQLQLATAAQLHAVRYEHGLMTEEYSSKEMLMQLEREREAFDRLFAAQWKAAKKQIRRRTFGRKQSKTDENGEEE